MSDQDVAIEEQPAGAPSHPQVGWTTRVGRFVRPRRRWCLGTRLVVTATVAWLLFLVAHLLASGRTSLWAPVDLIPPLLFLAVPALLMAVAPLARPVRWRILSLLLVAVLLGAGRSGVNYATLWHTPPPAPPGAVTVAAWNTEFWDQDWRTAEGDRFSPGFYDHLRALDADVYLLTEYLYVDTEAGDLLAQGWGAHDLAMRIDKLAELRRTFPGYQIAVSGHQLTLSRFPIVRQRGLDIRPWLPANQRTIPEHMRQWPEGYTVETLRTDVDVHGKIVSFYDGHVSQPPLEWRLLDAESRRDNLNRVQRREASYRAIRADIATNRNPVVLAGDLNTSPAMGIGRLIPEGLVDQTPALSSLYPATYRYGPAELWRIDWMYTTPDVTVHGYELPDAAGLSDHRAQRVVLSVS
ncbi:endonuclease/exonuclease/phosphatase family protein [Sphaerisporangium sp. TRM90804]|uniref:endonuclease/exonuclease/phosphatase family protein n=1 Tax=Sphaerisporangium sp. TRM90804 TaxID=3031113 RepID=UPI0024481365|nr:endonuclease/exonuclease/phosphatase family protein [Sphaerisporangium sp. TRM90804]MDH2427107.1 endonuclease/exonuclease/phosphatase family protein [Sphaerisporangium sp. TRM90804]